MMTARTHTSTPTLTCTCTPPRTRTPTPIATLPPIPTPPSRAFLRPLFLYVLTESFPSSCTKSNYSSIFRSPYGSNAPTAPLDHWRDTPVDAVNGQLKDPVRVQKSEERKALVSDDLKPDDRFVVVSLGNKDAANIYSKTLAALGRCKQSVS